MELQLNQEKLAKALNNVSRVATGSRAALPILSNVLIRVDDGKISFTTTNLDMAVRSFLDVTDGKNGAITMPARLIAEFISNLPRGENITISAEDTKINIEAGKYHSSINGALADDFPELPELDEAKSVRVSLNSEDFKSGLSQVMMAASSDMTRPALSGVYFNTFEGNLYVAAVDGYRLAEKRLAPKVEAKVSAIVPVASLQEVMRSLGDSESEIELLFDDTQVKFRLAGVEVISKLIDGSFPDYRQLIPQSSEINLQLNKNELVRITKLAALFAKETNGSIVCSTSSEKQSFAIASVANELGENSSEIPTATEIDGRVTLNSRFLLDAINAIPNDKINLGFVADRLDPVVLRGDGDDTYIHIVMPLKS